MTGKEASPRALARALWLVTASIVLCLTGLGGEVASSAEPPEAAAGRDTWDLVYRDAPAQQLTRVVAAEVFLRLANTLAEDEAACATLQQAAERMSQVSGVRYRLEASPPEGALVFDVDLDPSLKEPVLGHTSVRSRAGVVTGGRVTFRTLLAARRANTALHELGHTFGLLGHSTDPRNVMFASSSEVAEFSPAERSIFAMMQRRHPGNRFPDTDAAGPASLSVSSAASLAP